MARQRKAKGRVAFVVSFVLPEGAKITDAQAYVADAVATWRGSLRPPGGYGEGDPGDPMFDLEGDTVEVKRWWPRRAPT